MTARSDAEQQHGEDQERRRQAEQVGDEADCRWADENAGIAERGDRWNRQALRHHTLPPDAGEQYRHDVRAADADQGIAKQGHLPHRHQRRQC